MVCETRLRPRQTFEQRKAEVRRAQQKLDAALAAGRVKAVVDKRTGGIAFQGLSEADRDGVSDACAYRSILSTGSATARMAILKAEQLAGRTVDKQAVAQGLHAHPDGRGGLTWHKGH